MQLTARYRGAAVDYLCVRGTAKDVRQALEYALEELADLGDLEHPWEVVMSVRDDCGRLLDRRVVPAGKAR